jgi:hypothetical protein
MAFKQTADIEVLRAPAEPSLAPRFSALDKWTISHWSVSARRLGVRVELATDHMFLLEALHIGPPGAAEPTWILHKTPDGNCALRRWPGLADILPNIDVALGIVTDAIDRDCRASLLSSAGC